MPTLKDQHPRKLAGFGDNQSTFVKMHLMQHGIYLEYCSFGPKWHRKKMMVAEQGAEHPVHNFWTRQTITGLIRN